MRLVNFRNVFFYMFLTLCFGLSTKTHAAGELPYTVRSNPYSGFATTVHGDIRTVGMAGATMGLSDSFIASADNPAGLAMSLGSAEVVFNSNWYKDNRIQDYDTAINTLHFGAAASPYPFGFSLGFFTPYRESQEYTIPGASNTAATLTADIKEFRLSAAKVFWDNKIAVGGSIIFGSSVTEYAPTLGGGDYSSYANSLGLALGTSIQFPKHFLAGFSYTTPMYYSGDPNQSPPGISGFFQPIKVPFKLGFGGGWMPNRFFTADASIFFIGATPGAALLSNDSTTTPDKVTFHPRVGAGYQFADFKDFEGHAYIGAYYESVRFLSGADRMHLTWGIRTKPWIFMFSYGMDVGAGYMNYIVSSGVDLIKVMEKLDLIPKAWRPPYEGAFPRITRISDSGMPRPMVKNWKQQGPEIDPIAVGLDLPNRIEQKVLDTANKITNFTEKVGEKVSETIQDMDSGIRRISQPKPTPPQPKVILPPPKPLPKENLTPEVKSKRKKLSVQKKKTPIKRVKKNKYKDPNPPPPPPDVPIPED